jgi:glycerol uptake facilitator-like aquaporin
VGVTRSYFAEFIGTALLLTTVVGSGIMADDLSGGITGLALLVNALATGAMLFVLITVFGPISGAHFNPVVTLAMATANRMPSKHAPAYMMAQITGAIAGVWLAHAMFHQTVFQLSEKMRWGTGQWIAEAVATFGLLLTIFGTLKNQPEKVAMSVGLYITAAYCFTSSTSFANPAVTIARSLTNTFAGIAPSCVLLFLVAQIAGTLIAILILDWLFTQQES